MFRRQRLFHNSEKREKTFKEGSGKDGHGSAFSFSDKRIALRKASKKI